VKPHQCQSRSKASAHPKLWHPCGLLNVGQSGTVYNKMFLQWCGEVLLKVLSSFYVLVSGTGRGFGSAPLRKHKRWASCLSDKKVSEKIDYFWWTN
jgi:hypothetical protein